MYGFTKPLPRLSLRRWGISHTPLKGLFTKGTVNIPEPTLAELYTPVPPMGSSYEMAVWAYISQQSPYWEPQVQVGRYGTRGSTSIDFYNRVLRIAIQVDGAYIHHNRDAADQYITAGLIARGMKVLRWQFVTLEDAVKLTPALYRRDVGQ